MEGETLTAVAAQQSAPNLDDLVSSVLVDETSNGGNDALERITIRITGDGATESSGKKRGRPVGSTNNTTASGKAERKSKAQLQDDYNRLVAELATERARNNAAAIEELSQTVEMGFVLAFGAIASKRGPHWGMTKPEAENIGKAGAFALAPHAEAIRKYTPWGMFAAAVGGALYSRVQEDQRLIALHGVAQP